MRPVCLRGLAVLALLLFGHGCTESDEPHSQGREGETTRHGDDRSDHLVLADTCAARHPKWLLLAAAEHALVGEVQELRRQDDYVDVTVASVRWLRGGQGLRASELEVRLLLPREPTCLKLDHRLATLTVGAEVVAAGKMVGDRLYPVGTCFGVGLWPTSDLGVSVAQQIMAEQREFLAAAAARPESAASRASESPGTVRELIETDPLAALHIGKSRGRLDSIFVVDLQETTEGPPPSIAARDWKTLVHAELRRSVGYSMCQMGGDGVVPDWCMDAWTLWARRCL